MLFLPNGDVFEGVFASDQRSDGPGRLTYATGEVYEGNFVADLPEG